MKIAKFGHLCKLLNVLKTTDRAVLYSSSHKITLENDSIAVDHNLDLKIPETFFLATSHLETLYFVAPENTVCIKTNYDHILLPQMVIQDVFRKILLILPPWLTTSSMVLVYFPDQFNGFDDNLKPLYTKEVFFTYD
jgi:hypothetical protein